MTACTSTQLGLVLLTHCRAAANTVGVQPKPNDTLFFRCHARFVGQAGTPIAEHYRELAKAHVDIGSISPAAIHFVRQMGLESEPGTLSQRFRIGAAANVAAWVVAFLAYYDAYCAVALHRELQTLAEGWVAALATMVVSRDSNQGHLLTDAFSFEFVPEEGAQHMPSTDTERLDEEPASTVNFTLLGPSAITGNEEAPNTDTSDQPTECKAEAADECVPVSPRSIEIASVFDLRTVDASSAATPAARHEVSMEIQPTEPEVYATVAESVLDIDVTPNSVAEPIPKQDNMEPELNLVPNLGSAMDSTKESPDTFVDVGRSAFEDRMQNERVQLTEKFEAFNTQYIPLPWCVRGDPLHREPIGCFNV